MIYTVFLFIKNTLKGVFKERMHASIIFSLKIYWKACGNETLQSLAHYDTS